MKLNKGKRYAGILLSAALLGTALAAPADIHAASSLTASEKKAFTKYLTDGLSSDGDSFESKENGVLWGPEFYLADLNHDGHKDLIVTGALGLRSMTLTEVYLHVGNKYVAIPYNGTFRGISKKGFVIDTDDYTQAGAIRYEDTSVYTIDAKGNSKTRLSANSEILFYDIDTSREYPDGKVLSSNYEINGKKVSAKKYNAAYKKYTFKDIKWKTLTAKNIKKYVK